SGVNEITFTDEAAEDLDGLRKFDQKRILAEIEDQLVHPADQETRNRKRLRPNELAEWELRVGEFRVFYDVLVDEATVRINRVGQKRGNKLSLRGEEHEL